MHESEGTLTTRSSDRNTVREQARQLSLDAAERLAGIDGIGGVGLKQLAEEAGLSTMGIYSHFGDRFGLEEAFLALAASSLQARLAEMTAPTAAALLDLADAFRLWAHQHPARFSVLFLTSNQLDAGLHATARDHLLDVARTVARLLGWKVQRAKSALSLLAALSGFVAFELRGLLGTTAATEYRSLVISLAQANQPAVAAP